jgi:hypothetical protein
MSVTMTIIRVTILGGPTDGWSGRIRVPLEEEALGRIRLAGIVFRVHHGGGRMLLVHPSAQGLLWRR